MRLSKKSNPKRILVISQTNIGDVVLSCPVIDILRKDFPQAKIDVVAGPRAVSLFEGNPHLCVKMFDKRAPIKERCVWFADLCAEHYDCVVDLRHTLLPIFLRPRYATPVLYGKSFKGHKREAHLNRLRQVYEFDRISAERFAILTTSEDELFFKNEVAPFLQGKDFVVIAPGAADSAKRWHPDGFADLADHLAAGTKIIFVGDAKDVEIIRNIQARMKSPSLSLGGKINLRRLGFILKRCSWALVHDSGVMHLASYFNVPLVVLWGPTDIHKYAPWSKRSVIVRRNEQCVRCQDHKSKLKHTCMSSIEVQDVIKAIEKIQP